MGLNAIPSPQSFSPKGDVAPINRASTISGLTLLETRTPTRVAVVGEAGSGKTSTILSLLSSLALRGLSPDEIWIEVLDFDGGLAELLKQIAFPKEYLSCIKYTLCSNFIELVETTEKANNNLHDHVEEHGDRGWEGAWLIVDDMSEAWRMAQDSYCRVVYGMSLVDRMKMARASQEDAKKRGPNARGQGIFNQQLDYGTITPMHNDWSKFFPHCGYNFLWLSPWKLEDIEDENNNIIGTKLRFGQGDNDLRVSYIIKKAFDANKNRTAEFLKSRSTRGLPKHLKETSWDAMWKALRDLETLEHREQEAELKKLFPTPTPAPKTPQKVNEEHLDESTPTEECLDAIDTDADFDDW